MPVGSNESEGVGGGGGWIILCMDLRTYHSCKRFPLQNLADYNFRRLSVSECNRVSIVRCSHAGI